MAHVVCHVQPTSTGVSLTWSDGPAAFAPYELSARALTAAADAARKALGSVVECYFSEDAADGPAVTAGLATSGFALYQALFKTPAEQQAQANEIRKWLDKLQADGAIETLEIVAEGEIAVPWNLVYDRRPDPAAFKIGNDDPARWRPFWGLRYDLAGGRRVSPLRRLPVLQNPRVVVVADPLVVDRLLTEARELDALCREHGWAQARSRQELADALQAGRPDILYWLGHTQTEPFGLVLGEEVITPEDLKTLLEGDPFADAGQVFGGVAFLNACGTASGDKSGSFLDVLHPLGLSGYIATEQSTVDTFAAPLGREFLSAFVVRGEPLGRVMRQLRGQVPLGLLYGSYCPSSIQVRREPHDQAADAAPIVLTQVGVGIKLRRSPDQPATEADPLPTQPYRSLQSYGVSERALFAGRDDETLRFAQLIDEPTTRLVILHGESGVGKTSFLRAGVIPYLERECIGYRFARDRTKDDGDTILLVRATNDPVAQIATALTAYCSRPLSFHNPLGEETTADLPAVLHAALGERTDRDALRDALHADPGLLGRVLSDMGRVLPFTPVLVIDQAEEVFTLARTPADEENRNLALEMLRRAATGVGGFKVVVSLRTEYQGRFTDRLRKGTRATGGVRDYLLTDFDLASLIEVIRLPTSAVPIEHAAEIPLEKYQFQYANGVAEEIAKRARAYSINRSDSVLPLLQVICTQLYDRVRLRPEKVITLADLEAIGGVGGGMRAHAETLVARLFPRRVDQKAFKKLLADPRTQLFIRQSDGSLTTALLPASFLARHWSGRMPFDEVLRTAGDGEWRLVRVNSLRIGSDNEEQAYVSLGHDALAKVAARWQEEQQRWAQLRKYAAMALVGIAVAVTVFVFQAQAARRDALLARKELDETRRRHDAQDRAARLYAEAERDADAAEWEKVVGSLRSAFELVEADPDAFGDWPLRHSATELRDQANIALTLARQRETERIKFVKLGEHHADAVFFITATSGLGLEDNLNRVRQAAKTGLGVFGIDVKGNGPPRFVPGLFSPAEAELATARCYELLLLDAQAMIALKAGGGAKDDRGRFRDALDQLDRADNLLGVKTRSGLARRAEYLDALGEKDKAKRIRDEAAVTDPKLAIDFFLIGLELHRRGEFARAIPALGAALRVEPGHFGAKALLAVCYLRDKRYQDAKMALTRCIEQRPTFIWPRLLRASAEIELARKGEGSYPDALADLQAVLDNTSEQVDRDARFGAFNTRGLLEKYRGNWDSAIADLNQAKRLRPDSQSAYINLAFSHRGRADDPRWGAFVGCLAAADRRRRDLDDSLRVLDEAIANIPRNSQLHHERGQIRLLLGHTSQARADLEMAVALDTPPGASPTGADDLLALGMLMQDAGEHPLAVSTFNRLIQHRGATDAHLSIAYRHKAEALIVQEKWEDAADALKSYLKLNVLVEGQVLSIERSRQLAGALKSRGIIHAQLNEQQAALDCYSQSARLVPDPYVLILRGKAYLVAGASKLAQDDFNEALKQIPATSAEAELLQAEALLGRAETYLRFGQLREAVTDAEHAEGLLRKFSPELRKPVRIRLSYNASRVFAQIVLLERDPEAAGRHLKSAASFLHQTRMDLAPDKRAKFWTDVVLKDPALSRISVSPAITAVGKEFLTDDP